MLGFGFGFNRILPKLGNGSDPDALEFITNWETNTSAAMPETQRLAVIDWYRGMKGEGTTHGTDLLTIARSVNARIYILIPLDNLNASASAYELDAVSNGVLKGTYVNMVAGDFTPQGVIGGATKYFDSGVAPDDYSLNNNTIFAYSRTDLAINSQLIAGSLESLSPSVKTTVISPRNASNIFAFSFNSNSFDAVVVADSLGLFGVQRDTASIQKAIKNNAFIGINTELSTSINPYNYYFHGANESNLVIATTSRQLCHYSCGIPSLDLNQLNDYYTVTQRLQSNVITGGRQIGTAIPPIS